MPPTTTEPRRPFGMPIDPREHEAWFVALPDAAKRKFRAQWRDEARHREIKRAHRRERLVQTLIEAAGLLLVIEVLFYRPSVWAVVGAAAFGSLTGWLWHVWSCGRAASALIGIFAFLAMRVLCGMGSHFQVMCALPIVICVSIALAIPRENGRFGA